MEHDLDFSLLNILSPKYCWMFEDIHKIIPFIQNFPLHESLFSRKSLF